MPEMKDLIYHGVRQQITRVLKAMGEDRISQGLTAFENGASTWSACFFARAYPEVRLAGLGANPELQIANLLGMGDNKVPMRIVYHTFDGVGITMTKKAMHEFIRAFLDEGRDPAVNNEIDKLIAGVNYEGAEEKAVDFAECAVVNHAPAWMERETWDNEQKAETD